MAPVAGGNSDPELPGRVQPPMTDLHLRPHRPPPVESPLSEHSHPSPALPPTRRGLAPRARHRRATGSLLAVALVAPFAFAPGAGAAGSSGGGRLEGTVELRTALPSGARRYRIYREHNPGQALPAAPDDEMQNVVVYLESVPPSSFDPRRDPGALAVRQTQERFEPHVLPIVKGSVVEFPNLDPIFHNVFSLSRVRTFDLGRYPQDSAKSVRFDEAGVVKIFCHIHADMSAVVLVLDNPYFTKPGPDGSFLLDDIPAGEYRAVAWHERAPPSAKSVRIVAGATSMLQFVVPLQEAETAKPELTRR